MENRTHMKRARAATEMELAARSLGELLAGCVPRARAERVRRALERLLAAVHAHGARTGAVDRQAVASLLQAILDRSRER
jgi:hypothetical protein